MSEFHAAVDKLIVTKGDDLGRVHDIDFARDLAEGEQSLMDHGATQERIDEQTNRAIKAEIASQAVSTALGEAVNGYSHHNEVVAALANDGHEGFQNWMELTPSDDVVRPAVTAARSYDDLVTSKKQ